MKRVRFVIGCAYLALGMPAVAFAMNGLTAMEIDERWPALFEHRFAFYKWKLCRVVG
jgi:hypothetical protein